MNQRAKYLYQRSGGFVRTFSFTHTHAHTTTDCSTGPLEWFVKCELSA